MVPAVTDGVGTLTTPATTDGASSPAPRTTGAGELEIAATVVGLGGSPAVVALAGSDQSHEPPAGGARTATIAATVLGLTVTAPPTATLGVGTEPTAATDPVAMAAALVVGAGELKTPATTDGATLPTPATVGAGTPTTPETVAGVAVALTAPLGWFQNQTRPATAASLGHERRRGEAAHPHRAGCTLYRCSCGRESPAVTVSWKRSETSIAAVRPPPRRWVVVTEVLTIAIHHRPGDSTKSPPDGAAN